MKKFEWGSYENRCSFCGGKGHNIRGCKEINIVAEQANKLLADDKSITYKQKVAIREMRKRQAIAENKKGKIIMRRKPRCGFCKKEGHNKKNCSKIKTFRKNLYRANQVWRTRFAEKTQQLGVGVGSLIQVRSPWDGSKDIAMISAMPTDNLTVFSAYAGSYEYQTIDNVEVVSPKQVNWELSLSKVELSSIYGQELFGKRSMFAVSSIKIIAGSPMELSDDWVREKSVPSLEWLIKDHSLETLEELGILNFIDKWK